MIIEPGFFDHYKIQNLALKLGEGAVLALIRLWLHCHQRKRWIFNHSIQITEAICLWRGRPGELFETLVDLRLLDLLGDGSGFEVHGWAQANDKLIAKWSNGRKGGRPRRVISPPNEIQASATVPSGQ